MRYNFEESSEELLLKIIIRYYFLYINYNTISLRSPHRKKVEMRRPEAKELKIIYYEDFRMFFWLSKNGIEVIYFIIARDEPFFVFNSAGRADGALLGLDPGDSTSRASCCVDAAAALGAGSRSVAGARFRLRLWINLAIAVVSWPQYLTI